MTLQEAAKVMRQHDVAGLPVRNDGRITGIITDEDLVHKAVAEAVDPTKTQVKQLMQTELVTIAPDKDIYEALRLMRDREVKRLPVFEGKKMVGFLTLKDILKIEPQLFDLIVEKYELKEENQKPVFGSYPD
jgi:predicted transcriptional regulator